MFQKSKSVYLLAIVTAIVLLAPGPIQLVSPAYADHCEKNHKKLPGCGGNNDPGAEIPVKAMFDCSNNGIARNCPDSTNPHRIQGDGGMSYTDGDEDVTAHIRESGILQLRTDAKGGKPGDRNIYWDFSEGTGFSLTLGSGLLLSTTDGLPTGYGHASVIQVGRGTANSLDFRTLSIGDSAQTNLWATLTIQPKKGGKEFVFIRFEAPDASDQCPDLNSPTTITVTRLGDTGGKRQWEIVGNAGATACIQGTDVDVMLGPFRFVAQEK